VAHLIQEGVAGNRIVLLSFTRTAVRELRLRIRALAVDVSAAAEVDVRTLDSFAGHLRTGANLQVGAQPRGTFEEGVQQTLELFRVENPVVRDTIDRYRHVLVDEAQDLVGDRASLVRALLDSLPARCGWTIFLDTAQAIFDWSETSTGRAGKTVSFVDQLVALGQQAGVQKRTLETIHRTSDPELLTFMQRARRLVLAGGKQATRKIQELAFEADGSNPPLDAKSFAELAKKVEPTTLFLFRTRAEALEASRWLSASKVEHRLRFGDLPYAVSPWMAAVANVAGRADLTESQFIQAWAKVASDFPKLLAGWEADAAWQLLRRLGWHAPAKLVSVHTVAGRLNQAGLPDDLVRKEIGSSGPIVGTIHGSKGREAPTVYACLRPSDDEDESAPGQGDESRVIYVALTRAMVRCNVRKSEGFAFQTTRSRRPWRYDDKGYRIRLECGRAGDVDAFGALAASGDPSAQQQSLASWTGTPVALRALKTRDAGLELREWRHVLSRVVDDQIEPLDRALGSFSKGWTEDVHRDIFLQARWHHTPSTIYDLQMIDLATVAAAPDDSRLHSIPEPWRTTRLWLAPIVTSWAKAYKTTKGR